MLEATPRIASPPSTGLAREEIVVRVDGLEQTLEIVRQPRIRAVQSYWLCPRCSLPRWHLYVVQGVIACRVCLKLRYRSKGVPRAVRRATRLRRRLGAEPGVLSPLPQKPKYGRRDYWDRTVAELAEAERVIAEMLRGTVRALERRKGRLHGPR